MTSGREVEAAKMLALLEKALQRTAEGRVRWRPGESDGVFRADIGSHTIEIASAPGGAEYQAVLRDSEGRTIAEATASEFQDAQAAARLFRDLHVRARRIAMRTEDAIDAMIADLEDR